jgi:hypothetical protein
LATGGFIHASVRNLEKVLFPILAEDEGPLVVTKEMASLYVNKTRVKHIPNTNITEEESSVMINNVDRFADGETIVTLGVSVTIILFPYVTSWSVLLCPV